MWLQALTSVIGLLTDEVGSRRKIKQAKTQAEINRINSWQVAQVESAKSSWKDEWFTVLLSIPFAMCFIPELADYAHYGFSQLDRTPEWYRWMFGLAASASFGVRMTNQFKI